MQCSLHQNSNDINHRVEKSTLKFIWKHKRPLIAKAILNKKSNTSGITISNLKLYYRAIAAKTAYYWHRNKYADQWNRIEDPDTHPHNCAYLIFDKSATPKTYSGEKTASSTIFDGKTGYLHAYN
jgi:hypothetical protein